MKKFFKISGYLLLTVAGLLLLIALLVNIPWVQNRILQEATRKLSKDLHTTVRVKHIDLNLILLNRMQLNGMLVEDHNKDTLLYAGALTVRITDWFLVKDKIVLKHLGLENAVVKLQRADSVWNYAFMSDYFSSPSSSPKKKNSIDLDLKTVDLRNIRLLRKDEWRGEDMFFSVSSLNVDANQLSIPDKNIDIRTLELIHPVFKIYNYQGNRPPRLRPVHVDTDIDTARTGLEWNPDLWKMAIGNCVIRDGTFSNGIQISRPVYKYFDGAYMVFTGLNTQFRNVKLQKDTVSSQVLLRTKERSGFEIKSLAADFRLQPHAMEFAHLDIRTNRSRLRDYFAMRYHDFDDLSDFIDKVTMEGNFKESEVDSDDLAYFAPEISTWKKKLQLNGKVKGSVADLTATDVRLKAGTNTAFNGDIKIVGLPDIETAFLDVRAADFRTTYADALAFVPQLKNIREPDLRQLQYLKFRGYFTGLISDFITSGVIETGLGTVVTDMNLKMPAKAASSYYGTLEANRFNLGALLGNDRLGRVDFNGKIKGKGFSLRELQAELDGQIKTFEFNHYTYRNINVNGSFRKKLFNGKVDINDSNLVVKLEGLIDLQQKQPRFDLGAEITRSNLKRLRLYDEDIDILGKVQFNFSGSDIDNFEGVAKVFDASLYKDAQRISFDSLTLTSDFTASGKRIEVHSNEFQAKLEGQFSIKELPTAFQTFLTRYYPSYINPSPKKLLGDDFTFEVSTRKIEDYIGIFTKGVTGFNASTVSGRINTQENLFDLTASIPKFSYGSVAFYNVALKGKGNLDTLSLLTRIEDTYVNDSLHFPGTELNIRSSQDLSTVNIFASASQTLNAANISGKVQTLKDGVRIQFNPSTFEINGKKWAIDKDGELVLSKKLVTTDGIKIYNNEQEVRISSTPSSIGSSNDLLVNMKNINIGDFAPFFSKDNRLEGLLNSTVEVIDPFGNLHVDVKGEARQFRFDDDSIGLVQLGAMYAKSTGILQTKTVSDNPQYGFSANGLFNLLDSTRQGMDLKVDLHNTNIHLLEKYMVGIFSRMSGEATGTLEIVGGFKNLKYLGAVKLENGGLLVDYTKCYYKIPEATIKFEDGVIDFGNFPLKDTLNNSGELVSGKLYHQNFKSMSFDFHMRSNKLLILNTTSADNSQFYGSMIGKVNMSLTGPMEDMRMDIKGEPTDTSNIYLPIGSSRETGTAGYIVWKVYGREMRDEDLMQESNMTVSLDITANKYANVFVILDELTGDIIAAKGNGNIRLEVGTQSAMTMRGRFNIERGNYTFTFQSLKRNFKLREDAGSYISWNGDPYNAVLNIEAEYEAENVRFGDLLSGSEIANFTRKSEDVTKYRSDVLVIANITGNLNQPDINFRIELPQNSQIRNSWVVNKILSLIKDDQNELNKQVSFLILFNSFGPYTGGGAQSVGTGDLASKALEGIVVNSISGFLSSILTTQFSSVLQDIFKDKSLKVNINASVYNGNYLVDNYNPNQIALPDRTSFNVSVTKNFFNERLSFIVGGALDFGLNTAQQNQSGTIPFLPDVTAEWRLTPDGKFRLTFFYRENYTYLGAGGKQNRSGTSISFRKDFDRLDEIFRKKKKPRKQPLQ